MSCQPSKRPTKLRIIQAGARLYLDEGFTATTNMQICKQTGIRTGQLTFHFPTKEHLLLEVTKHLLKFHWKCIDEMHERFGDPLLAYCMELAASFALCEESPQARDIYVSMYTMPMTLQYLKDWNAEKSYHLLGGRHPLWTTQDFWELENVTTGIELSALMTPCDEEFTLERKIARSLDCLMTIYKVLESERERVIQQVMTHDYRQIGKQILQEFDSYIMEATELAT